MSLYACIVISIYVYLTFLNQCFTIRSAWTCFKYCANYIVCPSAIIIVVTFMLLLISVQLIFYISWSIHGHLTVFTTYTVAYMLIIIILFIFIWSVVLLICLISCTVNSADVVSRSSFQTRKFTTTCTKMHKCIFGWRGNMGFTSTL